MGFFDLFKEEKRENKPLLTPEQIEAQRLLLGFGRGEGLPGQQRDFGGRLGDFALTDIEREAGLGIRDALKQDPLPGVERSRRALEGILDLGFNPNDPRLESARRAATRFGREQSDILDREAAITGNRFSTSIGREKGLLAERIADIGASTVANLFGEAQNRSLQAATALANLSQGEDDRARADRAAAVGFGALERSLRDAEARAKFDQFNRSRAERLGVLGNIFNRNVGFGELEPKVKSLTPFGAIVNQLAGGIGQSIGQGTSRNQQQQQQQQPGQEQQGGPNIDAILRIISGGGF